MLVALLLLQLTQAPPPSTVVVVTRRTAVPTPVGRALAAVVSERLKAAGVELAWDADGASKRLAALGVKDSSACQGRRACIQEFGRQLGVAVIVGVSVSELAGDRSVVLEAVRVGDGEVLARESLLYPKSARIPDDQVTLFAARVRQAIAPAPAPVDVPLQPPPPPPPVLQPAPPPAAPPPAPVVVAPPPPPARSHVASVVLGTTAVLAAATAVTLGVLAAGIQADLGRGTLRPDGRTASPLQGSQALAAATRANRELVGAAACGGIGVALGIAAVVAW